MLQRPVPSMILKEQKKLVLVGRSGLAQSKCLIGVLEPYTTSGERFPKPRRRGCTSTTIPPFFSSTTERRRLLIIGGQESFHGPWPLTSPCFTPSPPASRRTHFTNIWNPYAREYSISKARKRAGGWNTISEYERSGVKRMIRDGGV